MMQTVQITELALTINAQILAPCMTLVAKMPNVKPEDTDQCVGVPMDGQEIHTQNVIHVGYILNKAQVLKQIINY